MVFGLEQPRLVSIGEIIHHFDEVASTNDVASELAHKGAPEGTCVVSLAQTAGRGRRGRNWFSPAGAGLCLSVLLRPKSCPDAVPQLSILSGVAVAAAIGKTCPCQAKIKWPNDVTVSGKKLAGVLVEVGSAGREASYAVVGIGINTNARPEEFPPELSGVATSLKIETGRQISTRTLLDTILQELDQLYKLYISGATREIFKRWCDLSDTIGRGVRVEAESGAIEGEAVGLGPNGFLLVKKCDGVLAEIRSGDLKFTR